MHSGGLAQWPHMEPRVVLGRVASALHRLRCPSATRGSVPASALHRLRCPSATRGSVLASALHRLRCPSATRGSVLASALHRLRCPSATRGSVPASAHRLRSPSATRGSGCPSTTRGSRCPSTTRGSVLSAWPTTQPSPEPLRSVLPSLDCCRRNSSMTSETNSVWRCWRILAAGRSSGLLRVVWSTPSPAPSRWTRR